MYKKYIKTLIDLWVSLLSLLILLPLLLIVALLILIYIGRPVFFVQERPGYRNRIFKIIKFRTMLNSRDDTGKLLPDFSRLTKLGEFLRKNSLDELPELINVLKGDMSLVGPRPLRVEYLKLYSKQQLRRHEVKPGITGYAQINGRNSLTWDKKFQHDVWYVDNLNIFLDMKILFLTLVKVLKKEGINQSKELTMEPFKGAKFDDKY